MTETRRPVYTNLSRWFEHAMVPTVATMEGTAAHFAESVACLVGRRASYFEGLGSNFRAQPSDWGC